jgi:3-methyladenine DNA glycosylase AlkD
MQYNEILQELRSKRNNESLRGMAKFGINTAKAYGISIPDLRKMARRIGKNHELALKLWASEIHDARLLAGFIDEPEKVTERQLEDWVRSFDSWDVCDQVCSNLFDSTIYPGFSTCQVDQP